MKATAGRMGAFAGSALLLILASRLVAQDRSQGQCLVAIVSLSLATDNSYFQQSIGDLTFKMRALKRSSGWMLSLEDANGRDFICPVNPAMRACEPEWLGAGYGNTARQALNHGRELRFLLNESDYDRFEPYVERALSPATAAEAARATDEYLDQSDKLRTGLLRLTIVRADVSESDEVRSAEFKLEFFAPAAFPFAPPLRLQAAACPEATLPISERLPTRVPVADLQKYRNVRDASNWKNPYLTINRDGFDLSFQGGRMFGPISVLARTLVGLPSSVWPYGRVIAGAENGIRSTGDDAKIRTNREAADKILTELGVTVLWWPSN
jgi:hypothetical protein